MAATNGNVSAVVSPPPVPIANSFAGMNLAFPNVSIHAIVGACFRFRKQITVRPEMKQQSGWNNEMNRWLATNLLELDKTRRRITYNPDTADDSMAPNPDPKNINQTNPIGGATKTQDQILDAATDVTSDLRKQFDDNAPDDDDVLTAPNPVRMISQKLDGTDLNMPQVDGNNCPNDHLRLFIQGLDNFAVQATRLDSRNDSSKITKYESTMLYGNLSELWTILQIYGGENNRMDIPAGTLPNDEPNTFMGGANNVTNATTTPTGA